MSNTTVPQAVRIHGTNPQYLIEKITRDRIYDSLYWKNECFGLDPATLVDKAAELDHIGGTYGAQGKPSNFLCLLLKMLQIQPDKEIVLDFILNEDYKYIRALGAFYLRLTGSSIDIYQYLEPLYNDFRKLKQRVDNGYELIYMDEFIDILLTQNYYLGISFPYLDKRSLLESKGELDPRESALNEEFQMILEEEKMQQQQQEEEQEEKEIKESYHHSESKEISSQKRSYSNEDSHRRYRRRSRSDSYDRYPSHSHSYHRRSHHHRSHHHHSRSYSYSSDSRSSR